MDRSGTPSELYLYTSTDYCLVPCYLFSSLQTLQVNANFACDLLNTEYHKQVLEVITSLAMSDIPCTCNDASAIVYLRLFTCDGNYK